MNPLLDHSGLPAFPAIRPEHVEVAVREQLLANRKTLERVLAEGERTFTGLVEPLERMQHRLSRTWSPVSHLNAVMNNEALRTAYTQCLPLISEYQTELGQNEALYQAYEEIARREGPQLDAAQRKVLDNALRDFRLAGVALDAERKARFKELMQTLARLQAKFEENVLDSAAAWSRHTVDEALLDGLPQGVIARARATAASRNLEGWLLTLDQPTYLAVMTHASNSGLRRELYEAWLTRASDRGPHERRFDNSALVEDILRARHEAATLLGFASYTEMS
ncbi:MAG TPA: M3 family metallopeptidase, partial [Steroidobacteraceae bacterium]|nr:M3 family metallopeptidase [Steroidobacteraceae bacterium]